VGNLAAGNMHLQQHDKMKRASSKLMNADSNQMKELEDLKRKFFMLDQDRKNHYQST